MNLERVSSCAVKVSRRCQQGHLTQIGNHSRLTISYVYHHGPLLIVHDAQHQELLRMALTTDVTRYTVKNPLKHEISRHEDTTIILDFYQEDFYQVNAFTKDMERVFRGLDRFSSYAEARDSSSSGSEDENGAAAARGVTYWDCANCTFASPDEHSWICEECNWPRTVNWDMEWQCHCHRVYRNRVATCKHCRMWRCHRCTYINKSWSHRCSQCRTERRQ